MTDRRPLLHRVLGDVGAVVLDRLPLPLAVVRPLMLVEDAVENARDGWGRLRDAGEAARYAAVRDAVARHAPHGYVLDLGCSQAIVREGLDCRRYVGVDRNGGALRRARVAGRPGTTLVTADVATFVPEGAPDAVVLNEVLYYLPQPLRVAERYAASLAAEGVLVVCCYARTWPTRHLLRRLRRRLDLVETVRVTVRPHAWEVDVYRSRPGPGGRQQIMRA